MEPAGSYARHRGVFVSMWTRDSVRRTAKIRNKGNHLEVSSLSRHAKCTTYDPVIGLVMLALSGELTRHLPASLFQGNFRPASPHLS